MLGIKGDSDGIPVGEILDMIKREEERVDSINLSFLREDGSIIIKVNLDIEGKDSAYSCESRPLTDLKVSILHLLGILASTECKDKVFLVTETSSIKAFGESSGDLSATIFDWFNFQSMTLSLLLNLFWRRSSLTGSEVTEGILLKVENYACAH